ncbi:MAG: hypothetical protein ACRD45_17310 [Bryobacteraceae bacterium]
MIPFPKRRSIAVALGTLWMASLCIGQVAKVPLADLQAKQELKQDFTAFQPHYEQMRVERIAEARKLASAVFAREREGKETACSHQILFELESLLISSANFKFIDRRIEDLKDSLNDTNQQQREALEQNPRTGLWGACYDEWYLKVYASYDQLEKPTSEGGPLPRFLDRVNTPKKLRTYLDSISVSNVRAAGVDHEREFDEMLSILTRMLIFGEPRHYAIDPRLKSAMLNLLLHRFRSQETGWWGERYVRDGHPELVDDLSITFHEVSFLKGRVPDMRKVIGTALAVKGMNYPVGWLWQGHYWNHNNMDVARLFQLGWPSATGAQRKAMAAEIRKMLHWCLTDSLQPNGSFKLMLPDGSLEDAVYYGTAFLSRIGFFDRSRRFWTAQDFPEAPKVRARIYSFIEKHRATGGSGFDSYQSALEDLRVRASSRK